MSPTKPYIGRLRARPGPSARARDYAERDYYLWRCIGSAMHWGLPYPSAILLGMREFSVSESAAKRVYRAHGGRPTTDRTALAYARPEPFETIELLVLKHMPKMHGRLTRGKQSSN